MKAGRGSHVQSLATVSVLLQSLNTMNGVCLLRVGDEPRVVHVLKP